MKPKGTQLGSRAIRVFLVDDHEVVRRGSPVLRISRSPAQSVGSPFWKSKTRQLNKLVDELAKCGSLEKRVRQ
jgi:hypothetical protein